MSDLSWYKKIVLTLLLAVLSLSMHAEGPVFVDEQYSATTIEQYNATTMDQNTRYVPQNYTPYSSGAQQQRPPQYMQPQHQPYQYSNHAGYPSVSPYQSHQSQGWPGSGWGYPGTGRMYGGMMPFSSDFPMLGGGLPMSGSGFPMMGPGLMGPGMGGGFPGFGGFPFSTGGW